MHSKKKKSGLAKDVTFRVCHWPLWYITFKFVPTLSTNFYWLHHFTVIQSIKWFVIRIIWNFQMANLKTTVKSRSQRKNAFEFVTIFYMCNNCHHLVETRNFYFEIETIWTAIRIEIYDQIKLHREMGGEKTVSERSICAITKIDNSDLFDGDVLCFRTLRHLISQNGEEKERERHTHSVACTQVNVSLQATWNWIVVWERQQCRFSRKRMHRRRKSPVEKFSIQMRW